MAKITEPDEYNIKQCKIIKGKRWNICKLCKVYTRNFISYEGYNCVCRNCIRDMTDIFELSESDLEDIITNAGRDLAKGIEQ